MPTDETFRNVAGAQKVEESCKPSCEMVFKLLMFDEEQLQKWRHYLYLTTYGFLLLLFSVSYFVLRYTGKHSECWMTVVEGCLWMVCLGMVLCTYRFIIKSIYGALELCHKNVTQYREHLNLHSITSSSTDQTGIPPLSIKPFWCTAVMFTLLTAAVIVFKLLSEVKS